MLAISNGSKRKLQTARSVLIQLCGTTDMCREGGWWPGWGRWQIFGFRSQGDRKGKITPLQIKILREHYGRG